MHIHVTMELLLISGETNFMEVPKVHKIHKIYGSQKGQPAVLIDDHLL